MMQMFERLFVIGEGALALLLTVMLCGCSQTNKMSAQPTGNLHNGQAHGKRTLASTFITAFLRKRRILGGLTAQLLNDGLPSQVCPSHSYSILLDPLTAADVYL